MAETDFCAQFEKLADKAKTAAAELSAAAEKTRDQLERDVTTARERAAASAEQFKDRGGAAGAKASSQWDEIRGRWQAHVAKVRDEARRKGAELDAKDADVEANIALSYALDAIDFATSAIEEAEYATLDAMDARARAVALTP
jgi:hypothetical protein